MDDRTPVSPELSNSQTGRRTFNMVGRFTLVALLSGIAVTVSSAFSLSSFLTDRMVKHEARLSSAFIRNIVATEDAYRLFDADRPIGESGGLPQVFSHLAETPDVVRVNVFDRGGRLLWSSDRRLKAPSPGGNKELQEALKAELVVHSGVVDAKALPKTEHRNLDTRDRNFVETYTPIIDPNTASVVGVVELYRIPDELFAAIRDGHFLIWTGAVLTAFFLFVAFVGIIEKGQAVIERQHEQLVEQEGLAVVGEMGTAVAHGLRNPLASIRSSAEVALGGQISDDAKECANDIIAQVDRLDAWIRQLLVYARPGPVAIGAVDMAAVIENTADDYRRDLERRGITLELAVPADLPPVRGEPGILAQMLGSLIANAAEAMTSGGKLTLSLERQGTDMLVDVEDSGPGFKSDAQSKVFTPFYTTKQKGLGLGLPLVKRVIERFGGRVVLGRSRAEGAHVRLVLPIYSGASE